MFISKVFWENTIIPWFLLFLLIISATPSSQKIDPQELQERKLHEDVEEEHKDQKSMGKDIFIDINKSKEKPIYLDPNNTEKVQEEIKSKADIVNNIINSNTSLSQATTEAAWDGQNPANVSDHTDDSSALHRLSIVLLGLCGLSIIYVSYRFYGTRKGAPRPTTVKKYGVLTQRSDIEMLPLPLDDDEDDDTVFEVGNHLTNR